MNRIMCFVALSVMAASVAVAGKREPAKHVAVKRQTIQGVQYETQADQTASATLTVQAKGVVSIQHAVDFGKQRYLVVRVKEAYFKSNDKITEVVLPGTLSAIESGAFRGCKNLTKLTLPIANYTIGKDAFAGSENIVDLQGNLSPFLAYKSQSGMSLSTSKLRKPVTPLFSTYADEKLKQRMLLWQTKKDYETVEQYKGRVTDENRRKRMDEFVEELKQEYVALYAPTGVSTSLGLYDSEYGVFTIPTVFYGNIFAQVPKADAANFRANYGKVEVKPQFGVQGDTLTIVGCKFMLGDKVYENATNYAGKGDGNYSFELPPLDISLAVADAAGGGTRRRSSHRRPGG